MMVDMSPEAVRARLRTMDDLWLLSVKLMNSKRLAKASDETRKARALEIQDSIRQILFHEWDPIGVNDTPSISHEYDAYIAPIYRLLLGSRSEEEICDFLFRTERDAIGVSCDSPDQLRSVAQKLLRLDMQFRDKMDLKL